MTEQEKTENALIEAALLLSDGSQKYEGKRISEIIESLKTPPTIVLKDIGKRRFWGMPRDFEAPENWQV